MSTCNCKTEIEQALTENFRKNRPEFNEHGVRLEGYGFAIVGQTMVMKPTMPYKATAYAPNKAGGLEKCKSFKGTIVFKFCPFCGTKVDADQDPQRQSLSKEQIDLIRQALLDTAQEPFDFEQVDPIIERILAGIGTNLADAS